MLLSNEYLIDTQKCFFYNEKNWLFTEGNNLSVKQGRTMTDKSEEIIVEEKRHTINGVISVVLTVIALIMLMIIRPLGLTATGETGFEMTFVVYLFISMAIAIVGGFFGAMAMTEENAKKILPVIGLSLAGIFVIILTTIIVVSVSVE